MATTCVAMRGRLGDTEYFVLSMKAEELVTSVKIPKAMKGWEDESVEERYQRQIDYHGIRSRIAPYLANDDSRFFGALIVAALNFGDAVFEPLSGMAAKGLPGPYRAAAANMGFLTFAGGEVLMPLDGQHRLKAIEFAISGRDERDRPINGVTPCADLAQEDVTVILVAYEPQKARKIFTKVNRYAKTTTTGQNYVTDDDDILAVLTREVANGLIGGRLAKFTSNTLRPKDAEFTTLAILYNCNEEIVRSTFAEGKLDKTHLPDTAKQRLFRKKVMDVWKTVLEGIEVFADALDDKEATGDAKRREIRGTNLLGKPVAQECLVRAFVRLTGAPTNMSAEDACGRLNRLPWSMSEENLDKWQRVLWTGGTDGKIITKNRKLATALIAWAAGERITDERRAELLEEYRKQFPEGERDRELPALA